MAKRTPNHVRIRGDLDDSHGDIDTAGGVVIAGSVRGRHAIRAGGDVEVQGHVAAGARIFARGNITIGGRLEGGRLRAGGRLHVGTGSATRIVEGGEAFAVGGVVLGGDVGPSETASAAIGLLADPETTARLGKAQDGLTFVENEMVRILRTLSIKTVAKRDIEELFRSTPQSKRKFLIEILKQLHRLTRLRQELTTKRSQQSRRADEHLSGLDLRVLGLVLEGVQVRIGEAVHDVTEVLRAPVFHLADQAVQWHVDAATAAAAVDE